MSQNTENMMNDNLLSQYSEAKRVILRAKEDHQLVLFVGAGASIASGMPSWGSAIDTIAKKLAIDFDNLDYLRIPQYYFNSRGKKEYTQTMREIFRHGDYLQKHEIHDRIIEFDTETIITTNYDHLIEQAAEDSSQILFVVSKDADMPYRQGGKELIKMHGDFENDNFVLKEDDYLCYSRDFKLIENYIKSLIGTKVVLFIGYSFSDPDLKLIFSWVKDILGGDFQRAYLIQAEKNYDVNESEYFRNFGINVLYASVQLQREFKSNDLTSNLLLMLKWLLTKEKNDKLTTLYNELRPFTSMKYASQQYIKDALFKAGMNLNNGIITIYDTYGKMSDDETTKIFKTIMYEQWVRHKKIVIMPKELHQINSAKSDFSKEEIQEQQKQNNSRVNEYLKDFIPNNKTLWMVREILNVLSNSNVKALQGHLPRNEKNGWYIATMPLDEPVTPVWLNDVNTFNYASIERIIEENKLRLSESKPDLYMEQGYLQFVLGEYLAAYNSFKNAKGIFYRRHEYEKYFIAEFNRYMLARSIITGNGVVCGTKPEDVKVIKSELDSIDLNRLFNSLPNLGEANEALKDVYTFNVAYTLFQDAYQISTKVNEQANTNYSFFSGMTAFVGLRERVSDYYNYISLNMLSINDYVEHANIFQIYFQSIISSVTAKDITNPYLIDEELKTIHASELNSFDILTALKFIQIKELERMMNGLSCNLWLNEDAQKYLADVIDNCENRKAHSLFMQDTTFWKCLVILGHCNLTKDLVEHATKKLCEMITYLDYRSRSYVIITLFLNAKKQELLLSDASKENTITLLNYILTYLSNYKSESMGCRRLVSVMLSVLKDNGMPYNNSEIVISLLGDESRLLCLSMYSFLCEDCRKIIDNEYGNWKYDNSSMAFEFYYELVSNGIKKPDVDIEKKIIDYYNSKGEKTESDLGDAFTISDCNEKSLPYLLLDLYIRDLVVNKAEFSEIFIKHNIAGCEWLMSYEKYDYSFFDVKWLFLCTASALKGISENENAKEHIKHAIEEKYKNGDVSKELLNMYFGYFV